jgi:WD40 repeat protein
VITGSADAKIKVWMPELSNEPEMTFSGHDDEIICLLVVNDTLISTSLDLNIRMWDLKNYKCLRTF